MKIIAYSYNSDVHCAECAKLAFGSAASPAKFAPSSPLFGSDSHDDERDEHGILMLQKDADGNLIHPISATDEQTAKNCGTCGTKLVNDGRLK